MRIGKQLLIFSAILFGISLFSVFHTTSVGFNYFLGVTAFLSVLILGRKRGFGDFGGVYENILLALTLLFNISIILNASEVSKAVVFIVNLFWLPVLGTIYVHGLKTTQLSVLNLIISVGNFVINSFKSVGAVWQQTFGAMVAKKVKWTAAPVYTFFATIASLFIGWVLVALLASADPIFEQYADQLASKLGNILNLELNLKTFWEFVGLGVSVLVSMVALRATILTKLPFKFSDKLRGTLIPQKVRATYPNILLFVVGLVLTLFTISQIAYVTTGLNNLSQLGTTYSEFAVRGFWQFQFVIWILVGITAALNLILKRQTKTQTERISKILLFVVAANSTALFVGAFLRVYHYFLAYGLTQSRYLGFFGLVIAFVALVLAISGNYFKKAYINFFTIFIPFFLVILGVYALPSPDRIITQTNLNFTPTISKEIDYKYLATLSPDSRNILIESYFEDPSSQHLLGIQFIVCRFENDIYSRENLDWFAKDFAEIHQEELLNKAFTEKETLCKDFKPELSPDELIFDYRF